MIDPELFDTICADIATGTPAYKAMQAAGSNYKAFYGAIATVPAMRERYAHAKEMGLDAVADETMKLADECLIGMTVKENEKGTFTETGDNVARSRLQVETRKWLLAKLAPKKYGEHSMLEVSGSLDVGLLEQRIADGRKRLSDDN